jgi:prophage antirepressor-like protein
MLGLPTAAKVNIDKKKWFSAKEAADMLDVTEETVKKYCRMGALKGKPIGAKKRWHVQGVDIAMLRKKWGLDEIQG